MAWLKSVSWIILGQILGLTSELSSELFCGLCMAILWPVMAGGVV